VDNYYRHSNTRSRSRSAQRRKLGKDVIWAAIILVCMFIALGFASNEAIKEQAIHAATVKPEMLQRQEAAERDQDERAAWALFGIQIPEAKP